MKAVKRIIATLAAAAISLTAVGTTGFALGYGEEWANYEQEVEQSYTDVPAKHWAANAIARVKAAGWFSGYPDGSFRPNASITREEAMTVLVQFLGLELKETTVSSYHDVEASRWSSPYIEAGKKLFPVKATFNGQSPFQPSMPILREDVMYAMVIAKKYNNEVTFADQSILNMFSDKNSISESIKGYVSTAIKVGLVSGHANGTIGAQDPLTRAEFASMLYRAQGIGNGTGGGLADIEEPEEPVVTMTSIAVEPTTKTIAIGESFTVKATATMSDGTTSDVTSSVVLTSDNANVTISGATVTGAIAGQSTISLSGNDLLAGKTIAVTVNASTPVPPVVENGIVNGKVAYADDVEQGIEGAQVTVAKDGNTVATATTDASGNYEVTLPAGDYRITASFEGYRDGQINVTVVANDTIYAETIYLTNDEEGVIAGKVYDAFVQDGVLDGVVIKFREGGDNQNGDVVGEVTSAEDGSFSIELPAGAYTAEAAKEGYVTAYVNVVSQASDRQQDITLTPVLEDGEWRFVLTWGEHPYDLDSHLTGPFGDSRFHVYYMNRQAPGEAADLDVDDITSYGPETVTIYNYEPGVYRYSVHDYTNKYSTGSYKMSNSGAIVKVYNGSRLVKTFNMPTNVPGTLWTVFELENNEIRPINEITEASNPGGIASASQENDGALIFELEDK